MKREFKTTGQDKRLPMIPELLDSLHYALQHNYQSWYNIRMMQVLFVVVYFGLFHKAELVNNLQIQSTIHI